MYNGKKKAQCAEWRMVESDHHPQMEIVDKEGGITWEDIRRISSHLFRCSAESWQYDW
jgi:hypothetical protein